MSCHGASVGVIVRHADLGLLIKRRRGTPGWAFPAGHWERGEARRAGRTGDEREGRVMGWTHCCNYVVARVDVSSSGAFITRTTIVRCTECGSEGVSGVQTDLDPAFRDAVIDRQ